MVIHYVADEPAGATFHRSPALVPPQLGSAWVVLPLGYAKTGALIVVARDPTPIGAGQAERKAYTDRP